MLYNRCTGIYKFGNTNPRRIIRRSNLGHIFGGEKVRLMGREMRYTSLLQWLPEDGTCAETCSSLYRVSQEECARLWEGVPYVKVYRYNPNTYVQTWTVTEIMAREVWNFDSCNHLLITKYILKLAGICRFCNVNICTWHQTNLWVT